MFRLQNAGKLEITRLSKGSVQRDTFVPEEKEVFSTFRILCSLNCSYIDMYIYANDLLTTFIYCYYGALYISIGKDSCTGDSGGPLISRQGEEEPMYLKGIVSFGARRCGEKGIPGVYTKVSEYIRWISNHISR